MSTNPLYSAIKLCDSDARHFECPVFSGGHVVLAVFNQAGLCAQRFMFFKHWAISIRNSVSLSWELFRLHRGVHMRTHTHAHTHTQTQTHRYIHMCVHTRTHTHAHKYMIYVHILSLSFRIDSEFA